MKYFRHFLKLSATFLFTAVFVFSNFISFLPYIFQHNQLAETLKIKEAQAAVTYQSAGAIDYSTSGGTSVDPAYPASISAGDLLVLIIGMKPSTANSGSVTTPGGWTPIISLTGAGGYGTTLGADTGNTNIFTYYKVANGTESGFLAITITTNNISWAQIYRLSVGAGSTWSVAGATGSDITGNTSVSITHSSNPGVTAGDYVIGAMVIPTDVTTPAQFSAEALSQTGITFGTVTEISEPDSTIGNDIGGITYQAPVSSGTASAAPTFTATAGGTVTNVRGPGVFIRIREIPPPDATSYTNGMESALNFTNCASTGCGGRIGQSITVTGVAFGSSCSAGTTVVKIGTYEVPCGSVSSWTTTLITFSVPAGINVYGGTGTNGLIVRASGIDDPSPLEFWIFPDITSISPSGVGEAREGDIITITGNRFDSTNGTVVFQNCAGSDQIATIGVWGDTLITVTVPSSIADNDDVCDIKMTRAAGTGSKTDTSLNFIVLPDVTSMAVCSTCTSNAAREYNGAGDIDGIVMLQGNHLGTVAGSVDFSGGINFSVHGVTEGSCTTGDWSGAGTSVCVEINNIIANNTYTGTITLTRAGDPKTDAISFRILPQIISSVPVSGIIGDIIQINGDHFCQSGTCPVSPNRSTSADHVMFGSTQATDGDFQNLTNGAGACNGSGAAWVDTEICVKVPTGIPVGSQPAIITSNTSYTSNMQAFTVLSTIPNDPDVGPGASKGQFKSNGTTVVTIGAGTNETTVILKMDMSASISTTLEPQVEIDPVATAFSADNVVAGTPVSYTGTPITGSVTISTLSNGTSYHWRARVRNTNTNEFSNWITFGGNTENPPTNPAAIDFYIDTTTPVISGVCAVDPSASSCDGSSPTDIQAQIRWSTSESADEQVAYATACPTGQASAAATFSTLANKKPVSPTGSGAAHSQIISGLSGATTYHYMVRSSDPLGNVSYNPSTANSCNTFTTSNSITRIMKTNTFFIQTSKDAVLSNAYPSTFTIFIPESDTLKSNITFKSIMIEISGITVGTGGLGIVISPNLNSTGAVAHTLADPGSGVAVSWVISYPVSTINFDCPGCASGSNTLDMSITSGGASTIVSAKAVVTYTYTP